MKPGQHAYKKEQLDNTRCTSRAERNLKGGKRITQFHSKVAGDVFQESSHIRKFAHLSYTEQGKYYKKSDGIKRGSSVLPEISLD
jgi:hypothetical protein